MIFLNNRYFYCYSGNLKNHFLENGIRYIAKSNHFKTKKDFWIFEGDNKLNNLLMKWKECK